MYTILCENCIALVDKDRNRDFKFLVNGKMRMNFRVFYLQEDFVVTKGFSITLNAYRQQLQVENKLLYAIICHTNFFFQYTEMVFLCA